MSLAIDVARTSPSRKPVGAVLMRKNKVIATASLLGTLKDCLLESVLSLVFMGDLRLIFGN